MSGTIAVKTTGASIACEILRRGSCRSCDAPVFIVRTSKGKKMLADFTPDAETVSHFYTCPDAAKWRKPTK